MSRSLPWFKAYTEARWDKKLAQLTLAERGVWFNLLCFTSDQPERGLIDASDRESLALECAEGDEEILNSTIAKLQRTKHLVTVDGREGWFSFRTYEERQARRPSDEPAATRERKRAERSRKATRDSDMSRHVTRDIGKNGDVTRLDSRYKSIEKEEDLSLSGKVSNNSAVVGAQERASAAAGASREWSDAEAAKIAKRVAGILHLVNPNLDGLMAVIKQYPCAQQWLEAQAAGCFEFYDEQRPKKKASIRLFDSWLQRDEERRRGSASASTSQPLAPEKVLSNGHTTPDAQPANDPLYAFNVARARAKLVS